jgi:hypothetical protein
MPRDLFRNDDPHADLSYLNVRASRHRGAERARHNCDELWRDFEPYASSHFLDEFPYRFHQRWFEMYLTVALLRAGLKLECPAGAAPDVRIRYPDGRVLWLEAIAPTGGDESNPDRVEHFRPAPGEKFAAGYVPRDRVTMRVSSALHTKADKLRTYRDRAIIGPNDQAVIAINVRDIPHGVFDAETYGLGATYGVGSQYIVIDRGTGEPVDSGYQHRPQLLRTKGASVDVAPFLHEGLAHVAGALISSADAANCPAPLGLDFMLLPNPYAAPPYTERQLPVGREWRLERDGDLFRIAEVIEHSKRVATVGLFHATTLDAARKIIATGFVDCSQERHQGRMYSGVWLSDVPLKELYPVILLVLLPEHLLSQYELPSAEHGYRRWLVPADVLNREAVVTEPDETRK